ncbi:MAG: DUF3352 domain-containing protein [Candidatus Dormibacteraeota bacterium]|nr:DUF3352 domain-containing protein [Candidatus Dormibacteraeota bacterium]
MTDTSVMPPAGGGWSPPPPPPPPAAADAVVAPRHRRRAIAVALIAIVVVAGTVGGILGFRLLAGSADSLSAMAPSDTVVYVNAHLDPSAGQKLALNGVLDKFPTLTGSSRDTTINEWIDQALQGSGLTHTDVRPWLGNDISMVIPSSALSSLASSSSSATPDIAFLVSSTNDSQAQAAITTLRQKSGQSAQWVTSTYDGVSLQIATGAGMSGAFAVTNHTFIYGTSANAVHEVIDTSQGKHAALPANAGYVTAVGQVPSDRLGLAFVDVSAIAQALSKNAGSLFPQHTFDSLQGYTGFAAALVAHSNGVSVNAVEDFDPSKLSSQQRSLVGQAADVNGSLAFMPKATYAAGTMTGLKQILQGAVDLAGSGFGFDISSVLTQLGITGPDGLINHVTGDAGIDLTPASAGAIPGGAVVIGTDSDASAQKFVDSLLQTICGGDCSSATTQHDGDAIISSLPLPFVGQTTNLRPSWSVYHGWIIVGSSAEQVKAALDADHTGSTLTSNPDYTAVMGQVGGSNNSSLFIDIQPMLSAIRATLSPADQSQFDADTANLKPLKAFGAATHSASDHVSIDVFTLIQ